MRSTIIGIFYNYTRVQRISLRSTFSGNHILVRLPNRPHHADGKILDLQLGLQQLKARCGETFGKYISDLTLSGDIANIKLFVKHFFTDEVVVNLDVFGASMEHRVGSKIDRTYIVTLDCRHSAEVDVKIL